MGLFDNVVCEYPLPEGYEEFQNSEFQTKSLGNSMSVYVITEDKRLVQHIVRYEDHPTIRVLRHLGREPWEPARVPVKEVRAPVHFHGDVEFSGSRYVGRQKRKMGDAWVSAPLHEFVRFRARFTEGVLSRIDVIEDQRGKYDDVEKDEEW